MRWQLFAQAFSSHAVQQTLIDPKRPVGSRT